jgi:hypothetical protein
MTQKTENYQIAKETFEKIEKVFSELSMVWDFEHPHVQLSLDIPAQKGLDFSLNLNLQDDSELHISSKFIWCKLYSSEMESLSDYFYECVEGMITGKYRIVQNHRGLKMYNSLLQRPDEKGEWETIYRHIRRIRLPWVKTDQNIIRNGQNSVLLEI